MRFGATKETARVVDILEDFGEAIKIKREHTGQSLRKVAAATGVTAITICRMEGGQFDPRLSNVLPLLRWLFAADQSKGECGGSVKQPGVLERAIERLERLRAEGDAIGVSIQVEAIAKLHEDTEEPDHLSKEKSNA